MFSFVDTNVLTAAQLNGNFVATLDKTVATAQAVVSPITFNGGLTTTGATVIGLLNHVGAEVKGTTVVSAAGNYVAVATDRYVVIRKTVDAVTTVSLPASPAIGRLITIKDGKGTAAAFNITLTAAGADTIDGLTSQILVANWASLDLLYAGSIWVII